MSALHDGIQQVHAEAGGLLTLQVVQCGDMPALILDALAGSGEAVQTLRLTRETLANIEAAPRRKPALCGSCPRALRGRQFAIIIARPACDDPTQGIAMAVCARCGPDHGAIQAKAAVALARIWPDVRPISITHSHGGRA